MDNEPTNVTEQEDVQTTEPETEEGAAEPKTYTEEELNNRIDEVVKAKQIKWEKQLEKKKAQEDEAKKLEKMNADEKAKYEKEKLQQELESANSKLAKYEMTRQAQTMLEEAGATYTSDDLDHIVTSEAESTKANVQWLINHDKTVQDKLRQELLKGTTPKNTAASSIQGVDKDTFDTMTFAEKTKLAKENPEQFKKLTGGI